LTFRIEANCVWDMIPVAPEILLKN